MRWFEIIEDRIVMSDQTNPKPIWIPEEDLELEFRLMVEAGAKVLMQHGYTAENAKATARSILTGPCPKPFPDGM